MNILGVPLWFNFYHEGARRVFTKEARRNEETRETKGQRDKKIRVIGAIRWEKTLVRLREYPWCSFVV